MTNVWEKQACLIVIVFAIKNYEPFWNASETKFSLLFFNLAQLFG